MGQKQQLYFFSKFIILQTLYVIRLSELNLARLQSGFFLMISEQPLIINSNVLMCSPVIRVGDRGFVTPPLPPAPQIEQIHYDSIILLSNVYQLFCIHNRSTDSDL